MNRILKVLFVVIIARPVVLLLLGLNVQNRQKLPMKGPAVLAVNHNSHLDTLVLLSLYPLSKVHKLRPVAAADYFLKNPLLSWFALNVIGIIPLERKGRIHSHYFDACHQALDNNDILILFPEGTRGEPEKSSQLKKGIFYMIKNQPVDIPVIPVMTHGLGRALPRGEALLVPFNCDVVVGDPLTRKEDSRELLEELSKSFSELLNRCLTYRADLQN